MRKSRVQTVGFKLEDPYLEQLEKSARALKMSPGLYAHQLSAFTVAAFEGRSNHRC